MLFNQLFQNLLSGSSLEIILGETPTQLVTERAIFISPFNEPVEYYIGYDEPSSYGEGTVWIKTDYSANCVVSYLSESSPFFNLGLASVVQYTDGAWKEVNGYYGFEGNWVQFSSLFVPFTLSYTGDYTESSITYNDAPYKLYTLTSSGTLTASQSTPANIWVCGGGSTGISSGGGAGAYCATSLDNLLSGDYAVTIGAANGGTTSVGSLVSANGVTNRKNGGSGGGGRGHDSSNALVAVSGGSGDGITKYPFSDSTNFKCHCAGGGGGCLYDVWDSGSDYSYSGGDGGTNGGSGSSSKRSSSSSYKDGLGGDYGGGGRLSSGSSSYNSFFYGGGGMGHNSSTYKGSGYQGVAYILVPDGDME